MTSYRSKVLSLCLLSLILTAVHSCGPKRQVQRLNADQVMDLSGRWNDSDSMMVSEKMVASVINDPWLEDFTKKSSRKPVVVVQRIRNNSQEHIDTETFTKNLEKNLIQSRKVRFIADQKQRQQTRAEKDDQEQFAREDSAKEKGQETGADFSLQGNISQINDTFEGKQVRTYQVYLELIDIESHEKVWIEEKKIKKFLEQADTGW